MNKSELTSKLIGKHHLLIYILVFVNFLFIYKYGSRLSNMAIIVAVLIAFLQISVWFLASKEYKIVQLLDKNQKIIFLLVSISLLCFAVFVHLKIDINSLRVDRWSVISSYCDKWMAGEYPYFARSHLNSPPGPMPLYFLIALPFYLLGELNVLSIIGYLIILYFICKMEDKFKWALLFLMLTSVFMYWEIAVRSNIITFTMLTILGIRYFEKLNPNIVNSKWVLSALLCGLLLSTRSVYIIVYIVFYLSMLIQKEISWKNFLLYVSIAAFSFASTFLPFILIYGNDFWKMNPFIVQSSFLIPQQYILLFLLIALVLAFKVKSAMDRYYYSSIALFSSILIYFIYHIVDGGFNNALFGSATDISYFLFCIPFIYICYSSSKHELIGK